MASIGGNGNFMKIMRDRVLIFFLFLPSSGRKVSHRFVITGLVRGSSSIGNANICFLLQTQTNTTRDQLWKGTNLQLDMFSQTPSPFELAPLKWMMYSVGCKNYDSPQSMTLARGHQFVNKSQKQIIKRISSRDLNEVAAVFKAL